MESPERKSDPRASPAPAESGRGAPAEPLSSPGRAQGARLLRWFEAGLLVAAAGVALVFQLRLPAKLPTEADHRAVGEVLAAELRPGDALLLYPWWTERARLFAPRGLRVVGYLGSDDDDLRDHPRIWLLSQPELPRTNEGAFLARFGERRTPLGEARRFGTLRLRLFENGRYAPPAFTLDTLIADGRAYVLHPDGRRVECPRRSGGFRCPDRDAPRVALEWHELNYEPRRCLYLHPPGGDARLVLELPRLPDAERLELTAGIVWEHAAAMDADLTPIDVGLEDATGARLLSVTLPPGTEGVRRATTRRLPSEGPVRLWSRSTNPRHRDVCVELRGDGASR